MDKKYQDAHIMINNERITIFRCRKIESIIYADNLIFIHTIQEPTEINISSDWKIPTINKTINMYCIPIIRGLSLIID